MIDDDAEQMDRNAKGRLHEIISVFRNPYSTVPESRVEAGITSEVFSSNPFWACGR
jgi:hypothetical protein